MAALLALTGALLVLASLGLRRSGRRHRDPATRTLVLRLFAGLAAVALAVLLSALVEDVTGREGVALLDRPVARFVAAHRTSVMTSGMNVVSTLGSPAGMAILALAVGVLLGLTSRSWTPIAIPGVTAVGVIGLTVLFKESLNRARPPQSLATAAVHGHGFPSGHAAAAAAVCATVAWLCGLRLHHLAARLGVWAGAAIVTALVGISRVYLGVHWMSDVLGGWVFGLFWAAVVVSAWGAHGDVPTRRDRSRTLGPGAGMQPRRSRTCAPRRRPS